jgi:hypothetical protein
MLIRQNPLQQSSFDPETAYFCARLSREVISGHDVYLERYQGARASGYFMTTSMVECIYHLAPVLHYSKDRPQEHKACVKALKQAHAILMQLSLRMNVAKKALKALSGVITRWGGDVSEPSKGTPGTQFDSLDYNVSNINLIPPPWSD